MYFTYKVRYTNSSTEIPEFPIQPEIALELLMAANFLVRNIFEFVCMYFFIFMGIFSSFYVGLLKDMYPDY